MICLASPFPSLTSPTTFTSLFCFFSSPLSSRATARVKDMDSSDFLDFLGPDTSATIFTLLDDPADLARASAVSSSWRRFVICNQFSKIQCLRAWPEVSNFTRIQVVTTSNSPRQDVGSSSHAEWDRLNKDHMVYMHLSHVLLSSYNSKDCIIHCIGASSTDNFPQESIENTLEPIDRVEMRPSYWSSGGQRDPGVPECLIYRLQSDLFLIDEIKIQPFKAFFQYGDPIYSAKYVRFHMGFPKSPLQPQTLVSDDNEGQLMADDNYVWTYTSPEFPMVQENVLQSFKLPRPVLCTGGIVKIELLGRIQQQAMDGLYYICVSQVQIVGNPLSGELGVAPLDNGIALRYYTGPHGCGLSRSASSGHHGHGPSSKWHNFATRIWSYGTAGRIGGLNKSLLNRLFGGSLPSFVAEEGEVEELSRMLHGPMRFVEDDDQSDDECP